MSEEKTTKSVNTAIFSDESKLEELIRLYQSGYKWKEIERIMQASHGTCYNALKKAGIVGIGKHRNEKVNFEQRKELCADFKAHMPIEEIAAKYNISVEYCRDLLRKEGLVLTMQEAFFANPRKVRELRQDYENHLTWKEMAKKYQMADTTCIKYLKEMGVVFNRKRKIIIDSNTAERCIILYKNDVSIHQIALQLDIPDSRVYIILKEAGIYEPKNKTVNYLMNNSELMEFIVNSYQNGMNKTEIGRRLNLDPRTVLKILRIKGIVK